MQALIVVLLLGNLVVSLMMIRLLAILVSSGDREATSRTPRQRR